VLNTFRPLLLLIAAVSFGLGITLPLMRFEKLWLFAETPSLLTIVMDLAGQGEWLLALVVGAFSLIFPMLKMATTFQSAFGKRSVSGWASSLSKWSMMDVLIVAIVIFAAKTSGLASAVSQPGIWFYGLSAVSIAVASIGLGKKSSGS